MSEPECKKCGRPYTLTHGDEPTPYCDACAHLRVEELESELASEKLNLEATVADLRTVKVKRDRLAADIKRVSESEKCWVDNAKIYDAARIKAETQRDQLKAEVERVKIELDLERRHLEHERQTVEFLRSREEVLKSQVSELINQRNQLLPLQSEVERLKELHIMQLAAISVAANSNTDSTVDEPLKCHPDYKTIALSVVVVAVQREIWERKEKEKWHEIAAHAADRLKAAMGHISGEHPHWQNGAATLARFNAMEKQP